MRAINRRRIAAIGLACVTTFSGLFAASSAQASDESDQRSDQAQQLSAGKNVVAKLARTGNFNTLISAVQAAGLADVLANTNNITVFAPTDAAFAKIPAADLQALIADKTKLKDLLTYHVSAEQRSERGLARRGKISTLFGADIAIAGAPEDLVLNGNVGLTLGDIRATNGIIHQIDTVLTLPAKPKDVVDTAIAAGSFGTLVGAVQAAGLESTLRTTQNITVFAPTDAAFAKIPPATLKAITSDKNLLTSILTYHVAGRSIMAEQFLRNAPGRVRMLQGERVGFAVVGGRLILNGNVAVTVTDIKASNGIIHVIDTVLVPPSIANVPPTTAPATTVTPTTAAPTTAAPTTAAPTNAAPTTAAPTTAVPTTAVATKDIVDTAAAAGQFNTLIAAVKAAGLEGALRNKAAKLTVFAPTDAAFAKLGDAKINALLKDIPTLTKILTYHVLPSAVSAADVKSLGKGEVTTLSGEKLTFEVKNGKIILNGNVEVIITDIKASNGIIHVIDTVLTPPSLVPAPTTVPAAEKDILDTARAAGSFNTLLAALDAAHLTETIRNTKNITVFAPTDAAFAKLGDAKIKALLADPKTLGKILTYHVAGQQLTAAQLSALTSVDTLAGEKIAVNIAFGPIALNITTKVTTADIKAKNGTIHVIDTVLTPPSLGPNQPPTTVPATTLPATKDIVDTAIANGSFNTLVAAVQAAGLEQTLRTTKNITVFAPTDAAFAKLGDAKIAALLKDKATLTKILTYHVAPGVSTANDLSQAIVTTLGGERLKFTVVNGKLVINGNVNVVITDVRASNGIIHVIDAVLIPPSLS
jgi:transforming growth factor-beta-induced protein